MFLLSSLKTNVVLMIVPILHTIRFVLHTFTSLINRCICYVKQILYRFYALCVYKYVYTLYTYLICAVKTKNPSRAIVKKLLVLLTLV